MQQQWPHHTRTQLLQPASPRRMQHHFASPALICLSLQHASHSGNAAPPFRLSTMPCFMSFPAQTEARWCSPTPSIMGVPKRQKSSLFSLVSISQTSCSPGKEVSPLTIPIQGLEGCWSPARMPSGLKRSLQPESAANQRRFQEFLFCGAIL
jgi:hypothetical protein